MKQEARNLAENEVKQMIVTKTGGKTEIKEYKEMKERRKRMGNFLQRKNNFSWVKCHESLLFRQHIFVCNTFSAFSIENKRETKSTFRSTYQIGISPHSGGID